MLSLIQLKSVYTAIKSTRRFHFSLTFAQMHIICCFEVRTQMTYERFSKIIRKILIRDWKIQDYNGIKMPLYEKPRQCSKPNRPNSLEPFALSTIQVKLTPSTLTHNS